MPPIMLFHQLLRKTFQESNWTIEQLAEACDRHPQTIRKWLRGSQTPDVFLIKRLGKLLKDDESYFRGPSIIYVTKPSE